MTNGARSGVTSLPRRPPLRGPFRIVLYMFGPSPGHLVGDEFRLDARRLRCTVHIGFPG